MHRCHAHASVHEERVYACTLTNTHRWKMCKRGFSTLKRRLTYSQLLQSLTQKILLCVAVTNFAATRQDSKKCKTHIQKRQIKAHAHINSMDPHSHNVQKNEKDGFNNLIQYRHKNEIKRPRKNCNNNSPSKEKRHFPPLLAQCNASTNKTPFPWENIKMLCKSLFSFLCGRKKIYLHILTNKTLKTSVTSLSDSDSSSNTSHLPLVDLHQVHWSPTIKRIKWKEKGIS